MENEEYAVRLAQMLSQAMNASALIEAAEQGHAIDGPLLYDALGSLIRDLVWLDTHRGRHQLQGPVWPSDIGSRLAQLGSELQAWKPSECVPPGVLAAGSECVRFLKP